VTTSSSPARHVGERLGEAGRARLLPVKPWST
jgi:hypothetical protein